MIRAAALALTVFATPALAQTQGVLKAGDALRQCLQGSGAPLGDPVQLQGGIASANDFGWIATEIGPGRYRLDRKEGASFGITIEIQLTDAQGTAYCIAYGPALLPGDAVAAADRAMSQGLMPQFAQRLDPPPQGVARYYTIAEGPVRYALMAYRNAEAGDVAGFVISGLPPAAAPQTGAAAAPAQPTDAAAANFALAAELCLRPGVGGGQRAQLFRQAGFAEQVDRSTSNADTTHYFTAPAGTATAELYYGETPESCFAASGSVGVTQASRILDTLIPRLYPTYIRKAEQGPGGAICARYEEPGTPIPHVIGVSADGNSGACTDNGTARIYGFFAV